MAEQTEGAARLLVRALYYATDGESRWWVLPTKLNDLTKEAIVVAVDRGWMLVVAVLLLGGIGLAIGGGSSALELIAMR